MNDLYVDFDDESGLEGDQEHSYPDEEQCLACYAQKVLRRRRIERESKEPGELPAIYIPGKQSVIYQNIKVADLQRGDFAACHRFLPSNVFSHLPGKEP